MTAGERIRGRIARREATVCVVGLGYVGLPLAVTFADAGFRVCGVDTDAKRVEAVNAGRSHVPDVPSETVARLVLGRRQAVRIPGLRRGWRVRRGAHMRANAAGQDQGPGRVVHRVRGQRDRAPAAGGRAGGAGEHDVSGLDRGVGAAAAA